MKNKDYRIIQNSSQLTLDSLKAPYYHMGKACQFNFYELDPQIQNELQLDESKQVVCPVCHIKGQLQLDVTYMQNELKDDETQWVVEKSTQQMLRMQKSTFTHSLISQQQDVLKLQQEFNSKMLNNNKLSLEFIEKLNADRNNEIFQIYRGSFRNTTPTLIGIINFKLILFYHLLKLKFEFDIYDNTDKNNCIKLENKDCDSVKISEVTLINNFIYLIIQQENVSQLYRGSLQQFQNQKEPIFYIAEMPGYTLLGSSRLFKCQRNLLMIGNQGSIIVEDQINENVEMNEKIKIPELNELTQIGEIFDSQILLADLRQANLQGIGSLIELNISVTQIKQIRNYCFSVPNKKDIDFSLIHDNCFYLLNSESLNKTKAQVKYFLPGTDNNSLSSTFNIINHHSYLKVIIMPTTKFKVGSVSCALVGLTFQNSQTAFPGVLVFNDMEKKIEIELI
ncbi:unnamed protein product (macronuclear) [Paramecium tetraurelia]|uniref:Uncharacterized protein n=1 Tax=Paramecium tetraurelia TaxID=5888 RepID=A0DUL7_PARTE|nr:uncharacterized protein GSPATT00020406001 [Paramecium tetraurelia]CAK86734.1 unnamed protein product [Paramecium tetraurelia]|eukprot:XP_001454131.1 hypothetical protein (macronuclear) [Paramecium tetraurelia strain d4-2]